MDFWNKEEDEKLLHLINTYGTSWLLISPHFSNRTHSSIRNRWIRINQYSNVNSGREKIKRYNKCSKCGQIKKGHICGGYNFLTDMLIIKEDNKKLYELPNTLFKDLDVDLTLSSSLYLTNEEKDPIFGEYYYRHELKNNLDDSYTSLFDTTNEDNIKLDNISELSLNDNNFYEKIPPLGICTDLKILGVIIDICKENMLSKGNIQIINASPRVEFNKKIEKPKLKKKRVKISCVEYLSDVFKDTCYPSSKIKNDLIKKTGLKRKQIKDWFNNKRKGIKKNKFKLL